MTNFERRINEVCVPLLEGKDWNSVLDILGELRRLCGADQVKISCNFVLHNLIKYGCNDIIVAMKIIEFYNRWLYYKDELYHLENAAPGLRRTLRYLRIRFHIFRPLYGFCETCVSTGDTIGLAIAENDVNLATAVVKYVYGSVLHPATSAWSTESTGEILAEFWSCVKNEYFDESTEFDFLVRKGDEVIRLLETNRGRMLGENQRGFRRIQFIVEVLKVAVIADEEERFDTAECLRLYFITTPEPVVSIDELQEFLRFLLKDENNEEKEDCVMDIIETCKDVFQSEIDLLYSPRSLQHLCRYSIRDSLVQKRDILQNLIDQLPVPMVLKKFLCGVED